MMPPQAPTAPAKVAATAAPALRLTARPVALMAHFEGIVPEAYLDGHNIWTAFMGVAATSGVNVLQYKDKPQPIDVCLRLSIELLERQYLPTIAKVFAGHALTENQLAAWLSFLWRNGHLAGVECVRDFLGGQMTPAATNWMNWTDHGAEIPRAAAERDLCFKGIWPDLAVPVSRVLKPSYKPAFSHDIDVMPILRSIMGA